MAIGPVLRRPDQEHRTATTLGLLFDLCFVVAVAQVASGLTTGLPKATSAAAIVMAGLVAMLVARDVAPGVGEDAVLD